MIENIDAMMNLWFPVGMILDNLICIPIKVIWIPVLSAMVLLQMWNNYNYTHVL